MKTVSSLLLALFVLLSPPSSAAAQIVATQAEAKPTDAELDAAAAQARQRIIEIVNQPITHLPRAADAGLFSPGWFHDGAIKPDFNTVDIRATQEFPYRGFTYVTSDVTPAEMFIGDELEFNSMTKYFYVDRTLPKKRLSEAEMLEINRLYRVIGRDEQLVAARWRLTGAVASAAILAISLLLLFRQTLARGFEAVLGSTNAPPGAGRAAPRRPR